MNAPIHKIRSLAVLAMIALGLTACASAFTPATDPTSPVAARVQALVDANRTYPRWENFPRSDDPAPEPAAIAAQVNTLKVAQGVVAGEAARIDWSLPQDSAAFAEALRARVAAQPVDPATQRTQAEIDEYLRNARERGRAPPPIARR